MTDRKLYIDKFADKLKQFDDEIAKLENKAGSSLDVVKEKIDDNIKAIQGMRKNAGEKFSELKQSSSDAWSELRKGLEQVEKDLQTSIVNAKKKF
jgi:hypothetical protein